MGMFKDMFKLTHQAQELKRTTPTPGMGDMLKQASAQMEQLQEMQSGSSAVLQHGQPGTGIVRAMGTPARGAQWFNLGIDLQADHVGGRGEIRPA
jgi:hypothetical protein